MDFNFDDIAATRLSLSKLDRALSRAHAVTPMFSWRKKPKGFLGLVHQIVEQQVSTASAGAILIKLEQGFGKITPRNTLNMGEAKLKTLGLSGQKAKYIHALAVACEDGSLDFPKLRKLSDEDAIARLVALKGIGRWTAEAYLMFGEGRTDLFPAGDLALQEVYRVAARRARRPTEKELYEIAEKWRPNRGIAALLLWSYYAHGKREKSVTIPALKRTALSRGNAKTPAARPPRVRVAEYRK